MQVSEPLVVELGLNGTYQRRCLQPGNLCITPAGAKVAAARWRGERQILVAELSASFVRSVAESHDVKSFELLPRHAITDPQVAHLLLALRAELGSASPYGQGFVEMIARAMVIRLLGAHAVSMPLRPRRGGLSHPLLQRVIEYIDANLDQDLGLRNLAIVSGLSEDHFARAFRESMGIPPHRYLLQRRLTRARDLLTASDLPIAEIAQRLGFADQSHLTNLFRRSMGMTPGQLRHQLQKPKTNSRNSSKHIGIIQDSFGQLPLLS